jgi:hypothetical protein
VPVEAGVVERATPGPDRRGVGLFFSGGLDSMYSLLKHRDEITHAVFVHGCDVPLANRGHRAAVSARLRQAADRFGVRLVEVETDLLAFSDRYVHWGYHFHGSALAGIGMMLCGVLRKVYIASSYRYSSMVPWGSTFVTDPLWSSPRLEVVNDGGEQNRVGKTRVIAECAAALEHLRVCFENPEGGYNCGRCEKCYRTMATLRLCGALERCPAFDVPLDLARMVEDPEVHEAARRYPVWKGLREAAEEENRDPELIAAVQEVMRRSCYLDFVRDFTRMKRDVTASPPWREALPKFRDQLWQSLRENEPEWLARKVVSWLPEIRDEAFARLWNHDRGWLKRRLWMARLARLAGLLGRRPKRNQPPGEV